MKNNNLCDIVEGLYSNFILIEFLTLILINNTNTMKSDFQNQLESTNFEIFAISTKQPNFTFDSSAEFCPKHNPSLV